MNKTLLFLPDISGYTEFVQNTEINHSQHVISELLEILLAANTQNMQLAEIEGDALFFFKEELPTSEEILKQIEDMFSAFYSHLKNLEKNRICPCNACANAPKLQLKIIAHCGEIEFITVQNKRKPFGPQVIEAHRLLKNSIESDNYILITNELIEAIKFPTEIGNQLFDFTKSQDSYDNKQIPYHYSIIDKNKLKLKLFTDAKEVSFTKKPDISLELNFETSADNLLEYITNYSKRHLWTDGVDKFEFKENEVTRIGSEHVCVIDGKKLNFVTVTTQGAPDELVYGEHTTSPPPIDELFQIYKIKAKSENTSLLKIEIYVRVNSIFKKLLFALLIKRLIKKNVLKAMNGLQKLVKKT